MDSLSAQATAETQKTNESHGRYAAKYAHIEPWQMEN